MQNITIFYDVFFTFKAPLPSVFGAIFAIVADEVVIGYYFGADETLFKIGVYHSSGFGCGSAYFHGPCAHFFGAGGEISLQA